MLYLMLVFILPWKNKVVWETTVGKKTKIEAASLWDLFGLLGDTCKNGLFTPSCAPKPYSRVYLQQSTYPHHKNCDNHHIIWSLQSSYRIIWYSEPLQSSYHIISSLHSIQSVSLAKPEDEVFHNRFVELTQGAQIQHLPIKMMIMLIIALHCITITITIMITITTMIYHSYKNKNKGRGPKKSLFLVFFYY